MFQTLKDTYCTEVKSKDPSYLVCTELETQYKMLHVYTSQTVACKGGFKYVNGLPVILNIFCQNLSPT